MAKLQQILSKVKYPLLVLALGIVLMLLPAYKAPKTQDEESLTLCQALTRTQGVGESCVLISENGVVVVCDGAESAQVRGEIYAAVRSYTGFSSDKVTILKMA